MTLVAFEALAVATAMPVVGRDLGSGGAYALAFSLFVTGQLLGTTLAGGWCDRWGARGPVLVGLALFAGGLVACGAAPTFEVLLLGRAVSGVGGGVLGVSMYVVVGAVVPEERRPVAFGWISAAWVLPSLVGPPVAGYLAQQHDWRWVFLGVPPLVVLVVAVVAPRLRGVPLGGGAGAQPDAARRALAGVVIAGGAAALQWGAQGLAGEVPTTAVLTAACLVAGAAAVAWALPRLVPRGTLRAAHGLPAVVAVRGLLTAAFFGAEAFIPLMLTTERGLTPLLAGLVLTGGALGWAAGSWAQGHPLRHVPRHRLLALGCGVLAASLVLLLPGSLGWLPAWAVAPAWMLGAAGMGLGMSTTSVLVLALSEPRQQGRASSALQLSDSLGAVVGTGGAGAAYAVLLGGGGTFAAVFTALAAVALLGVGVGARARPAQPVASAAA